MASSFRELAFKSQKTYPSSHKQGGLLLGGRLQDHVFLEPAMFVRGYN